ncbi:MAG: hypothetical protein CHACPFDD_03577 [Phycisphaerae bacterium]|nr:hypothetical protein [Phycisphaerae bacterium]
MGSYINYLLYGIVFLLLFPGIVSLIQQSLDLFGELGTNGLAG